MADTGLFDWSAYLNIADEYRRSGSLSGDLSLANFDAADRSLLPKRCGPSADRAAGMTGSAQFELVA